MTPLYKTNWMGNTYHTPDLSHTNVCWGRTRVRDGNNVTLGTLVNLQNDFLSQPFNYDLGGSPEIWQTFSENRNIGSLAGDSFSMESQIRRMWSDGPF